MLGIVHCFQIQLKFHFQKENMFINSIYSKVKVFIASIILFSLSCIIYALAITQNIHAEEPKAPVSKKLKTSGFNDEWLDAVVSIEITTNYGNSVPIGTGFIVTSVNNHLILITAKHVVFDQKNNSVLPNLAVRLNGSNWAASLIPNEDFEKITMSSWFVSNDYDLACRFIFLPKENKVRSIPQTSIMRASEMNAGAPLLILGFPMGMRSEKHPKPIARKGIVARADNNVWIADAFVFPGNSGGPVVYVPAIKVGLPLSSSLVNEEKLVGLVISYEPYIDVAVSLQTKKPRITFEENSGLVYILSSDIILNLLNRDDVKKKDAELQARQIQ